MRTRPCLAVAAAAAVVVALAAAPTASARVPTFGPKTIVPGESIGGVKLNMTRAQAFTTWGMAEDCFTHRGLTTCQWKTQVVVRGFPQTSYYATIYIKAGRVIGVGVMRSRKPAIDVKLRQLKTSRGIRIGSTMASARAKYRIPNQGGGEAGLSRATMKTRGICTVFYAPEQPYTTITSIHVGKCNQGVTP